MGSRKKRKNLKLLLMTEIAVRLARGEVLPPEVMEYARTRGDKYIEPTVVHQKREVLKSRYSLFYKSPEWKRLRYAFLEGQDGRCKCCGTSARDGGRMHVDHIIPLRKAWDKRLDMMNLQLLCSDCNRGKGSRSTRRW